MSLSGRASSSIGNKSSSILLSSSRSMVSENDDPCPWQNEPMAINPSSSSISTIASQSLIPTASSSSSIPPTTSILTQTASTSVSSTPSLTATASTLKTTPTNNNQSNSNSSTSSNLNNNTITPPSQSVNVANSVESLISLAQKRITTFVYLKKVHEGKVHWFNTILLTRPDLEKFFEPTRMIRRTTRFAVLGMSLSSLLEIMTLQDFLRGILSLLNEYESIPDDHFKPKMVNLSLSKGIFKQSSKGQRKSSSNAANDYSIGLQDSNDPSLLYSPNIPFELDYFEVWITLSDLLVEVYQKIISFISDSSDHSTNSSNNNNNSTTTTSNNNSNNQNNNSSSSPRPSFNSMLSSNNINSISSNNNLGHSNNVINSNSSGLTNGISNSSVNLSQISIDMINKVDSKLKKLIVLLTKEIDGIARSSIREELTQLDPMLSSSIYNTPILNQTQNQNQQQQQPHLQLQQHHSNNSVFFLDNSSISNNSNGGSNSFSNCSSGSISFNNGSNSFYQFNSSDETI